MAVAYYLSGAICLQWGRRLAIHISIESDSIGIGDLRAGKRELFDSHAEIGVCFS